MALPYDKDQQITIRISKGNMDLLPRLRLLAEQSGVNVNKYAEKLLTVKKITYNLELDDTELILSNKGKAGTLGHLSSENKRETYIQNKTGNTSSKLN